MSVGAGARPPAILVRTAGLLTTVQDLGRWGWQHLGVPVGGAMDAAACRTANHVVGNDPSAAVLEITVLGPELVAQAAITVALSGGLFDASVDGRPLPPDTAVQLDAGALCTIGARRRGARAYLAVAGGIDTPRLLGSRATTPGVLGGRPLQAGDVVPIGLHPARPAHPDLPRAGRTRAGQAMADGEVVPRRPDVPLVRVMPGPDLDRLGPEVFDALCASPFVVGADSNRMGYRLEGTTLAVPSISLPSSGTVMGMLQLPPSGQPVLLMADRQTTGGYPVPAVVVEADLGLVAQLAPGDACRFVACTRQQALAARLALEREWLRG